MRRALALVGAVLLVAVAVVVRGVVDGDDDGGGGSGDGSGADAGLVVACIPELRDACDALDADVRIEDPAETIAKADEIDAWVTFDPWPAMAGFEPGGDRLPGRFSVARAELVLIGRISALAGCETPVTWTCAVDTVRDKAVLPQTGSALRPLVLGQASADFFGDSAFVSNDFSDADFSGRIHALGRSSSDPFETLRNGFPEPHAVGALAFQYDRLSTRRDQFRPSPTGAAVTVAVVVAGPADHNGPGRVAGDAAFVDALVDAGWTPDASATTTGLPDAGVLVALLQEVSS